MVSYDSPAEEFPSRSIVPSPEIFPQLWKSVRWWYRSMSECCHSPSCRKCPKRHNLSVPDSDPPHWKPLDYLVHRSRILVPRKSKPLGLTFPTTGQLYQGRYLLLFIIMEKTRTKERKWDGVGVMKDKEVNLSVRERGHPFHQWLNLKSSWSSHQGPSQETNERELAAPLWHCWRPRGMVFIVTSHRIKSMTHTRKTKMGSPYSLVPDPQNFLNFQKLGKLFRPWVFITTDKGKTSRGGGKVSVLWKTKSQRLTKLKPLTLGGAVIHT